MYRVRVVGVVVEYETVMLPFLKGSGRRVFVERGSVDGPSIKTTLAAVDFPEHEWDRLNGIRNRPGVTELGIVPTCFRWLDPSWRSGTSGIFDNDSHAVLPIIILRRAQNPYSGILHLDHR